MNIKKIIAREGLILLGVVALGCLIFFVSSVYPPQVKSIKTTPKKKVYTREQFNILDNSGLTVEQIARLNDGEYPTGITKRIEESLASPQANKAPVPIRIEQATDEDAPIDLLTEIKVRNKNTGERRVYSRSDLAGTPGLTGIKEEIDLIDEARAELDRRTEEKRAGMRWKGILFLFIGYTLYLMPIKFFIWAIRTLRTK